jgi:hypothetical protein
MYVLEVSKYEEKVPENPNCSNCYDINKKFNLGVLSSSLYASHKMHKFAYKLKTFYKFNKTNSFHELKVYKHQKTGKFFKPPQHFTYVNSYPELIKDIIAGKI